MRYTVRQSIVDVIGKIWQPGCGTCAYRYNIPAGHSLRTREDVANWLSTHAGDFQSVTDFAASLEAGKRTIDIPWQSQDSEVIYMECVS